MSIVGSLTTLALPGRSIPHIESACVVSAVQKSLSGTVSVGWQQGGDANGLETSLAEGGEDCDSEDSVSNAILVALRGAADANTPSSFTLCGR